MVKTPVQTQSLPLNSTVLTIGKPRQYGSHAVVICLGKSGWSLHKALDQAAQARPNLPQPICLRLGQAGWSRSLSAQNEGLPESNLTTWWQTHLPQGKAELQQAYIEALGFTRQELRNIPESALSPLNLYLAVDLLDPACLALFPDVLQVCREMRIALTNQVFTLFLYSDSTRLPHLAPAQADQLREFFSDLSAELTFDPESEPSDQAVGWCYLVDPMDLNSTPLMPISKEAGCQQQSQVELTADLILLLTAGLARHPDYQRTHLLYLAQDLSNQQKTARLSTFGISSLVMPVAILIEQAAALLAKQLLEEGLISSERPGSLPEARLLLQNWFEMCGLAKESLRRELSRDVSGDLLCFPVEPPKLSQIAEENLVESLLNWEEILWQRWESAASPAARMAENSSRIIRAGSQRLEEHLSEWVETELGGAKRSVLFIAEAQASLADEARQIEVENAKPPHWLTWLLQKIRKPQTEPVSQAEIDQARQRLEQALSRRLNRRAVWVQSTLLAVALLAFAWAASPYLARLLGLEALFSGWLQGVPVQIAELLCWSLICLVIAYAVGWARIFHSQNVIHRATTRLIQMIRARYADLFEQSLRQQQQNIYAALQQDLSGWQQRIEHRLETLAGVKQALEEQVAGCKVTPLFNEQVLGEVKTAQCILEEANLPQMSELIRLFLQSKDHADWKSESDVELTLRLLTFARHLLKPWLASLDMTDWLEKAASAPASTGQNQSRLSQWLEILRRRARVALPLNRQERSPLTARQIDLHNRGSLFITFAGLPVASQPFNATIPSDWSSDRIFSTGEVGRLSVVNVLIALNLETLGLWDLLPEAQVDTQGA